MMLYITLLLLPIAVAQLTKVIVYEAPFSPLRKLGKPFTCEFCLSFWLSLFCGTFILPPFEHEYNALLTPVYVLSCWYVARKLP